MIINIFLVVFIFIICILSIAEFEEPEDVGMSEVFKYIIIIVIIIIIYKICQ
jgi:hypothetical protein